MILSQYDSYSQILIFFAGAARPFGTSGSRHGPPSEPRLPSRLMTLLLRQLLPRAGGAAARWCRMCSTPAAKGPTDPPQAPAEKALEPRAPPSASAGGDVADVSQVRRNKDGLEVKVWGGAGTLDLPAVSKEQVDESFKDATDAKRAIIPPANLVNEARRTAGGPFVSSTAPTVSHHRVMRLSHTVVISPSAICRRATTCRRIASTTSRPTSTRTLRRTT